MNKIRLQFILLLLSVIALFAGVVAADLFSFEQMTKLYRLETQVATVLLKWNRMVQQSSGILSSNQPIERVYASWKSAHDAYRDSWRGQVAELEQLAEGDEVLRDQLAWVRNTLTLGADEMESLSSGLEELVTELKNSLKDELDSLSPIQLAMISREEKISVASRYYLSRVQDTVGFFCAEMEPALGKAQDRFQQEIADRISELNDRFVRIRFLFLSLILVILVFFLTRILKLNFNLMAMVHQRTGALDKALDDLKKTQDLILEARRQSAVASMIVGISHELNTPLGVLLTSVSKMRENHQEMAVRSTGPNFTKQYFQEYLGQQEELLDLSDSNIARMRAMINHFRTLSVQEQALECHEVDFAQEMNAWLDMLAADTKSRGHELSVACAVTGTVFTCPEAIIQVLRHLTFNSLEFGFPDGRPGGIRIAFRQEGDFLLITHQDDGIGIPPDLFDRVFEPFFTTGRPTGHMGLGMNIVHNLVTHILGGTIELEKCAVGTRILIRVPLAARPVELTSPI
jgi:signal transduction histidine kinase